MTRNYTDHRYSVGRLFLNGIVGGILAGIVFAMAEMLINLLILGRPFWGPLRLISSIVLGRQAVQPAYPFLTPVIVGAIVHMILSMIFGVIFVFLMRWFRQLGASTGRLLLWGSLYGLVLWVVNFLILAPILFPQFTQVNQFWNGFLAHTFFFGTVMGWYVAAVSPSRTESGAVA